MRGGVSSFHENKGPQRLGPLGGGKVRRDRLLGTGHRSALGTRRDREVRRPRGGHGGAGQHPPDSSSRISNRALASCAPRR